MTDGIKRSRTLPMIAFLIPTLTTALVLSAQPAEDPPSAVPEIEDYASWEFVRGPFTAGAGEGEVFLGVMQATTDAAGSVARLTNLASPGGAGVDRRGGGRRQGDRGASGAITATDLDTGDTSELSDCVVVLGGEAPVQENPTLSASDLRSLGLQPLPDEKVDWLFKKIAREERVEPDILHAALIGPQSALRADAARILAQWGDASSIPHLIHALTDESYHLGGDYPDAGMATTRYWAARSLWEMTGRDLGFVWNDPLDQRNAAVLRWSTWFQTVRRQW